MQSWLHLSKGANVAANDEYIQGPASLQTGLMALPSHVIFIILLPAAEHPGAICCLFSGVRSVLSHFMQLCKCSFCKSQGSTVAVNHLSP